MNTHNEHSFDGVMASLAVFVGVPVMMLVCMALAVQYGYQAEEMVIRGQMKAVQAKVSTEAFSGRKSP